MTLEEIKNSILNKEVIEDLIIFKYEDTDFIANQYTKAISNQLGKELVFVDALEDIPQSNSMFAEDVIYVYKCDNLKSLFSYRNDLIVITKTIASNVLEEFSKYVISIPKLEPWMVEDYILSYCKGLNKESAGWFLARYDDIYLITNELDKLNIFPEEVRQTLFESARKSNSFSPSADESILNLTNALQSKSASKVKEFLISNAEADLEPMPLIAMAQLTFKKLLKVWLNRTPTPENTGLKSNQIWAINKLPKVFTRDSLIKIFEMLSLLDSKIRSGDFPIEYAYDYIIIKILSA